MKTSRCTALCVVGFVVVALARQLHAQPAGVSAEIKYFPSYKLLTVDMQGHPFQTPKGEQGLKGEYFNNVNLQGEPALLRVDPRIDFLWDGGSPGEQISIDNFSVRWTGSFGPAPQDGKYQFTTLTDDGVRLWIDGKKMIDDWRGHVPMPNTAVVTMKKGESCALRMEFFEGGGGATCQLSWKLVGTKLQPTETATLKIVDEQGKQLIEEQIKWSPAGSHSEVEVGELPDGELTAEVWTDGAQTPLTHNFTRTHYVWEHNRLGKSDKIYPPFEPIEVEGNTVKVVMRSYAVGGLGLWNSVMARGNEADEGYEELLDGPIALRIDGGKALQGEGKFARQADHEVVYEGVAKDPAVTVRTRCTTEYDGCMKVELTLEPGTENKELGKLWLDIPIRNEQAPLWHAVGTGIRMNPAGKTPEGEGVVWDSNKFPDYGWPPDFKPHSFIPYIWLGAEERGLCWFADTYQGWVIDGDAEEGRYAPCITMVRDNRTLALRVQLVQRPVTIDKPRTIVFGLMASPGKPMPKNWRKVLFGNAGYPGHERLGWMGSTYWGAVGGMANTYPLNKDFSILDKMQEIRLEGSGGEAVFKKGYWQRNLKDYKPEAGKSAEAIFSLINWCLDHAHHQHEYYGAYWEEFYSAWHDETNVFFDEWDGGFGHVRFRPVSDSYVDFQCWYGAEFIRRGIGLYFDNSYPKITYNPVSTTAWRGDDGRIHPSAGIWWHRRYFKRIWILHQQLAPAATSPMMMFHMTNSQMVPYMTFGMSNLDLEWKYGPEPQQSKYPADLLRTETLGLKTGNIPLVLATIRDAESKEQAAFAERSRFGAMFVHEIRAEDHLPSYKKIVLQFGYGEENCKVYNYWDNGYPVKTSNDAQVKSILLKRNGELMIVVCTWNKDPEQVKLTLDTQGLGVNLKEARNSETGDALEFDGKTVALDLEGYAVAILHLK